jgi:hypothetical protein
LEIPGRLVRLGERLHRSAYAYRQAVAFTLYGGVVAVAYGVSFLFRFDLAWRPTYNRVFLLSLLPLLIIRLVCARAFRLSTGRCCCCRIRRACRALSW